MPLSRAHVYASRCSRHALIAYHGICTSRPINQIHYLYPNRRWAPSAPTTTSAYSELGRDDGYSWRCAPLAIYKSRYLQMRKTTIILLILTFNLTFSQSAESEFEFRKLTGNLVEENGQPFPGQIVMIKGTEIGATTDFDGNFCF